MTTTTLTLAAFLEARLAEDEAAARLCEPVGGRWVAEADGTRAYGLSGSAVLVEVAAKRAVLAAYEDERQRKDIYNRGYDEGLLTTDDDRRSRLSSNARWAGLDLAVRYMVQVYSDHADFRPEWLPENW